METTQTFLSDFFLFLQFAKWMVLAAVMLVVADLYFGILAARTRSEVIKRSRAIRRTMDKLTSYLIWIILAYTFGQAFLPLGIELLPLSILIIIYVVELESIYINYFQYRGKSIKINLLKILKRKIGIEELIEDKENEKKSKDQ